MTCDAQGVSRFENLAPGTYFVQIVKAVAEQYATVNNPAPLEAHFSTTTSGAVVTTANVSTGGWRSYWQFGDGSVSHTPAPVHQYSSAGSYTVTLTISDVAGCISTETQTVAVEAVPGKSPARTVSTH
jgi:PKD repeat protein